MVHYQCEVCSMSATCVATPAAVLAWLDHMDRHGAKTAYRSWTWKVVELDLGVSPDTLEA